MNDSNKSCVLLESFRKRCSPKRFRICQTGIFPLTGSQLVQSVEIFMISSHSQMASLGLVIADVTDKGIPAALVMATTRNTLRTTAERLVSPGKVLAETNNLLCPDMPMSMFVTCLYALLDPINGHLVYANAGHPPPYQRGQNEAD